MDLGISPAIDLRAQVIDDVCAISTNELGSDYTGLWSYSYSFTAPTKFSEVS